MDIRGLFEKEKKNIYRLVHSVTIKTINIGQNVIFDIDNICDFETKNIVIVYSITYSNRYESTTIADLVKIE